MPIYDTNLRAASRNRTREDTGVVVTTEREFKLIADADFVLPDLSNSSRGVSSGVTTTKRWRPFTTTRQRCRLRVGVRRFAAAMKGAGPSGL
jgi:hypothetical protein